MFKLPGCPGIGTLKRVFLCMQNFILDTFDRQYVSDWQCRCTSNDGIFSMGQFTVFDLYAHNFVYLFVQNPESDYGFV